MEKSNLRFPEIRKANIASHITKDTPKENNLKEKKYIMYEMYGKFTQIYSQVYSGMVRKWRAN